MADSGHRVPCTPAETRAVGMFGPSAFEGVDNAAPLKPLLGGYTFRHIWQ